MPTISITRKIEFSKTESKAIARAYEKTIDVKCEHSPNLKELSLDEFVDKYLKK